MCNLGGLLYFIVAGFALGVYCVVGVWFMEYSKYEFHGTYETNVMCVLCIRYVIFSSGVL